MMNLLPFFIGYQFEGACMVCCADGSCLEIFDCVVRTVCSFLDEENTWVDFSRAS